MNSVFTNCPWLPPAHPFPSCEEWQCSFVQQPANTYSNIMFFIIGFTLIYLFFKTQKKSDLYFGLSTLFIGVSSAIAHATALPFWGYLDFLSIFSAFCLHLVFNSIYLNPKYRTHFNRLFIMLFLTSSIFLYFFKLMRVPLFTLFIIAILYTEYLIAKINKSSVITESFKKALLFFGLSLFFLILDVIKWKCNPENHYFQFHMLWHVFNAFSLFFIADHIKKYRTRIN